MRELCILMQSPLELAVKFPVTHASPLIRMAGGYPYQVLMSCLWFKIICSGGKWDSFHKTWSIKHEMLTIILYHFLKCHKIETTPNTVTVLAGCSVTSYPVHRNRQTSLEIWNRLSFFSLEATPFTLAFCWILWNSQASFPFPTLTVQPQHQDERPFFDHWVHRTGFSWAFTDL